jgi:hypothetical protein
MSFDCRLKNDNLPFKLVSNHSLNLTKHVLVLFFFNVETELNQIQVLVHHCSHSVLGVVIIYQDVEKCISLKTV